MKRPGFPLSDFAYRLLLLGYPRAFRDRFGEQMREDFQDQLEAACQGRPLGGRLGCWRATARDLALSVPRERLRRKPTGGSTDGNRSLRWSTPMSTGLFLDDVRFAFRSWRRSPSFVLIAALTIALGIGATTTIFSIANALLIQTPTGVRNPERLVTVLSGRPGRSPQGMFSYPIYRDLTEAETGLSDIAALSLFSTSLSAGADSDPELVAGLAVSHNYFRILGTLPHLGRFFVPEEDLTPGAHPVAVLSYRKWSRTFGADSSIVGRTVVMNRTSFTVVGVAEEGFQGHVTGYDFGVFVPMAMAEAVSPVKLESRGQSECLGIGRMASNVPFDQVAAAFEVATQRQREMYPEAFGNRTLVPIPYAGMIELARTPVSVLMGLLFGIAGVVLLIASVNVAGMLLSRSTARSKEIAVRLAVGAGRRRVVAQLLTESVMLFLLGGGFGVALTFWATRMLDPMRLPLPVPIKMDFTPDLRVLGFTLALAFATGLLFGLAPALRVTRPDLVSSLKEDGGHGGGRRNRMRSTFVVAQVVGSVVLLVLAGIFGRALSQASSLELGFDPDDLHVYSVDVSLHDYTQEEGEAFFREFQERISALPGVQSEALARVLPLGFNYIGTSFPPRGDVSADEEEWISVGLNAVSPEFFETLGTGVVAGRTFTPEDRQGAPLVAVLNETAATQLWPGEAPLGKSLPDGNTAYEVVGIVRDGKYRSAGEEPRPMVYLARPQRYSASGSFVIRTVPGRADLSRELAQVARSLDPNLPAQTNAPYTQVIDVSLLPNRAAAWAAAGFGVLGLLLACVGLYGVLSYSVSLRNREIGVRMALGADRRTIRRIVLGEGLRLIGLGLLIGLPLALGSAALVRSMLLGLSPADPVTFGGIVALLLCVGLLASYLPARRATLADPMEALRCD